MAAVFRRFFKITTAGLLSQVPLKKSLEFSARKTAALLAFSAKKIIGKIFSAPEFNQAFSLFIRPKNAGAARCAGGEKIANRLALRLFRYNRNRGK